MNREIKFRAMAINVPGLEGQWVTTDEVGFVNFFHSLNEHYLDEKTLGQFTGLYDKNGVEIYEGDVLDDGFDNALPIGRGWYEFPDGAKLDCWILRHSDEHLVLTDKLLLDCEIIGNIYENPNLLKGGEKH